VWTRHGWAVDGGFTNDLPCCDSYTVTISSLNSNADIYPKGRIFGLLDVIQIPDLKRVWQAARMGEIDAAACPDLKLEHWINIKKPDKINQYIPESLDMAFNQFS